MTSLRLGCFFCAVLGIGPWSVPGVQTCALRTEQPKRKAPGQHSPARRNTLPKRHTAPAVVAGGRGCSRSEERRVGKKSRAWSVLARLQAQAHWGRVMVKDLLRRIVPPSLKLLRCDDLSPARVLFLRSTWYRALVSAWCPDVCPADRAAKTQSAGPTLASPAKHPPETTYSPGRRRRRPRLLEIGRASCREKVESLVRLGASASPSSLGQSHG